MKLFLSKAFLSKYKKLTKNNDRLKLKIKQKISYFKVNPTHPSLKLHRLQGKMIDNWSISIDDDLRIIFTYSDEDVLFIDIGRHDEVY